MAPKACGFWDCDEQIRSNYVVCRDHYPDFKDGNLDECPNCGQLKDASYEFCLPCNRKGASRAHSQASKGPSVLGRLVAAILDTGEDESEPTPARRKPRRRQVREVGGGYAVERSPAWAKNDEGVEVFYTYILKLDDSSYYAGHTRELLPRLMEHGDGATKSTAGREPKLVWFARSRTREEAATYEAELKRLIDRNPRAIRRMIVDFRQLLGAVDTEA